MSATADQELAELRRANAELLKERDAAIAELQSRSTALAQRNTEYGERIQHQSATIDVLKVMSASPSDPQPVFQLIVQRARVLCNADNANLALVDGNSLHLQATTIQEGLADYTAQFPRPLDTTSMFGRAVLTCEAVQTTDLRADLQHFQTAMGASSVLAAIAVPLLCAGVPIGAIGLTRSKSGEFSATQLELLRTFAEQAVITVASAETYRALQTRTTDLQESLEYQTATSDVLKVISRSTFDLQPVLDTVAETAARLCDAEQAAIYRREGDLVRLVANCGFPPEYETFGRKLGAFPLDRSPQNVGPRAIREGRPVHIHDVAAVPGYGENSIRFGRQRTSLGVPLMREGEAIGSIVLARQRVEPFTERQIDLVSTFANQAVIAIENTRLLNEQREALEQQTATAEVLQVINSSPGNLAPVFDAMLEKAMRLCGAAIGGIYRYDGEGFDIVALLGVTHAFQEYSDTLSRINVRPGSLSARMIEASASVQYPDVVASEAYRSGVPYARALVELGGIRAVLDVPLLKEGVLLGFIAIYRKEPGAFSDKQVALLESFAAQAVIAMENARLLNELRQRQQELRITFENMGDGVAMFDETPRLVAWNRKFQDIMDLPDGVLADRPTFADYIRYLAERGEYGSETDPEEEIRNRVAEAGRYRANERVRPDGRIIEIRQVPVAGGGFVMVVSDITERKRNEDQIRAARDAAEEASRAIEAAYRDLKAAQASLIQAEKMASLGQLTAGIAHEIKNPLNFVNNFASLSVDLLDELKQAAAPGLAMLDNARRAEIDELTSTLASNLGKINEHGRRADGIVRGMLEHSRGSSGERRSVDLNNLVEEALNLAYHGARAQDQNFNVTIRRDFGEHIAPITLAPQDLTRVLLNLCSNGFYAARERQRVETISGFEPILQVATREINDAVEILVHDNGTGIPSEIKDRLFQPFFTTKPPGEGTGLGLSMSYEIITQQHSGSITVDSKVGEYSEFTIRLPRRT